MDTTRVTTKEITISKEKQHIKKTERITRLIKAISADMYEREETIAVTLLGALSGQNTFLYGPPGTAKSLISCRLTSAFAEASY